MEQNKLTGYPSIDKPWLKYYSEEAINAPLPECTIFEYLWENNKDYLDDVALNYFDRIIKFKELFDNIEKTAKAFSTLGLKQGDIIIMTTVTTPETIYAFYALNRLGVIANMVDPRTSTEGIKDYIKEVNAEYVLTIDVAYPKIEKAIEQTNVKKVIVVSPADSLAQPKKMLFILSNRLKGEKQQLKANCIVWDKFIAGGKDAKPQYCPYKKDSCCVIVHTGGTTGTPKGVMLSNDNFNAMALQYYLLGANFNRRQNFLNIMPPFIAYGIVLGIHMPLSLGLNDVLIPQLDPNKFADLIVKYKPAFFLGVPSHFEKLRTSPKMNNFSLDFFESAGAGGDAISAKFEEDINEFLKSHKCKYKIGKGYGMTEISSSAIACYGTVNKYRSVGVPNIFTTVSVFDPDTGDELKYGEQGEICMCAPTVMLGYYKNERETAGILRTHSDGKKWIHSGDIGHIDEDGFVFIDGRLKRLIIRNDGFKIFPSLIENVVASYEAVKSCCAVGKPDTVYYHGQVPIVYVSLKAGYENTEKLKTELNSLCQKTLPEYAQPAEFYFLDELPLTPIGKVDYRTLEKMAEEKAVD